MAAAARFQTLEGWLRWQEGLHPSSIDLGLGRVATVGRRLGLDTPACPVITVGGTNGKGSCVALLQAMLSAAGYRVGSYTSPHIVRYNERICVDGQPLGDAALCTAFAALDEARGDISLTYFEFGTLAALYCLREAGVDVLVLEVGLGGRLDAVNIVDADVAVVTSVGIDHVEWLGSDRDGIGREKAGIMRPGRVAVCGDRVPPAGLLGYAEQCGALLRCLGRDFEAILDAPVWHWVGEGVQLRDLPLPALTGRQQVDNAATALMALHAVGERLPVTADAVAQGLREVRLAGRFEVIPGAVEWVLDVTHNAHGAAVLGENLRARPVSGRTWVVLGMLADKDAALVGTELAAAADGWFACTLGGERGRAAAALAAGLREGGVVAEISEHASVAAGCEAAAARARPGDRVLVFGSFHTVAEALAAPCLSDAVRRRRGAGGIF